MPIVSSQGDAAGPAYVFLHGSPSDSRVFGPLMALAPPGARVVAVDLPDHGRAPDEPAAALAPLEADALAAARAQAPRPVVLVGNSLGAYLAARIAPALGAELQRLVLTAGFATLPEDFVAGRRALAGQIESGELTPQAVADLAVQLFLGAAPGAEAERLTRQLVSELSTERLLRSLVRANHAADPALAVTGYAAPARVLHGTRDRAVPLALGEGLAARGERAELIRIDTDAHLLPLTHAELVARHVFAG